MFDPRVVKAAIRRALRRRDRRRMPPLRGSERGAKAPIVTERAHHCRPERRFEGVHLRHHSIVELPSVRCRKFSAPCRPQGSHVLRSCDFATIHRHDEEGSLCSIAANQISIQLIQMSSAGRLRADHHSAHDLYLCEPVGVVESAESPWERCNGETEPCTLLLAVARASDELGDHELQLISRGACRPRVPCHIQHLAQNDGACDVRFLRDRMRLGNHQHHPHCVGLEASRPLRSMLVLAAYQDPKVPAAAIRRLRLDAIAIVCCHRTAGAQRDADKLGNADSQPRSPFECREAFQGR